MSNRDDFPEGTKRTVAARVNNRCSNPTCGAQTSGPQEAPGKSLNIGVAAHITAASGGGPRYDPNLTEEQRRGPSNAIWLCQNCAKLIDNDSKRYSEPELWHWKEMAEAHALAHIGRQAPFAPVEVAKVRVWENELALPMSAAIPVLSKAEMLEDLKRALPAGARKDGQIELLYRGTGAAGQPCAVVALGDSCGSEWDVIFFCAGELGWEVVARTYLAGQKGYVPVAHYVPGAPGALVLTHVAGYGTGVFRRSTSWYRIARGEPIPLLTYATDFYVVDWGMPFNRELKTTVQSMPERLQTGAALKLHVRIEYTTSCTFEICAESIPLFIRELDLTLIWDEAAGKFIPQTAQDDPAIVEELWSEGRDGWVKHNAEQLQGLKQNGTSQQREFVTALERTA
jgi:hypothetical protein